MLVSVAVITYNSSKYIIETLESVKRQDYDSIQLVISDDCSTDDTVEKCKIWLENNKSRFVNPVITVNAINKGVPANINNAIKYCDGIWVKAIAGDDILFDDCISKNLQFTNDNTDAQVVFSNVRKFKVIDRKVVLEKPVIDKELVDFFRKTVKEKLLVLYEGNILPAASLFIRKDLLQKFPYNERYVLFEDYPMWITLLRNNIDFHYLDSETIYYRTNESISHSDKSFFNEKLDFYNRLYFYDELSSILYNYYPDIYRRRQIVFFERDICRFLLKNKYSFLNRILLKIIMALF